MRCSFMMAFSRVAQTYAITLCKQNVKAGAVQIVHLFHQFPVILNVLFQSMHIRKRGRSNKPILRRTQMLHSLGAGALWIMEMLKWSFAKSTFCGSVLLGVLRHAWTTFCKFRNCYVLMGGKNQRGSDPVRPS